MLKILARWQHNQLLRQTKIGALPGVTPCIILIFFLWITKCSYLVRKNSGSDYFVVDDPKFVISQMFWHDVTFEMLQRCVI